MKKLTALALACLLTFAFAATAQASFNDDWSAVGADGTLYLPAPYAADLSKPRLGLLGELCEAMDTPETNMVFSLSEPGRFSQGDTIAAGDDVLTIALADCGDPADRISDGVIWQVMQPYRNATDLQIVRFTAANMETVDALRHPAFTFFGFYRQSDGENWRIVALYHAQDKAELYAHAIACGVIWDGGFNPGGRPPSVISILGDADLDGRVTAKDARLALRASAKLHTLTPTGFRAADLDGNGRVTAGEARRILRVSAKLDRF